MNSRALLLPVVAYAALGLVLSLFVHMLSFENIALGGRELFHGLQLGLIPLWLIIMPLLVRRDGWKGWRSDEKTELKTMMAGCPLWMKYMTYGFLAYALSDFIVFIFLPASPPTHDGPSAKAFHSFSGHWMFAYSLGLSAATSLYRRGSKPVRCMSGHIAGLGDSRCSICGAAIIAQQQP